MLLIRYKILCLLLKNRLNLCWKMFMGWKDPNYRDFKNWYNMPNGFSGIAAQFGSGPFPNCAALPARKTGAVWENGAIWRDAVWQWLLYPKYFRPNYSLLKSTKLNSTRWSHGVRNWTIFIVPGRNKDYWKKNNHFYQLTWKSSNFGRFDFDKLNTVGPKESWA